MGPLVLGIMAREEAVHLLRRQEYLDEVSSLDLPSSYAAWYNVDVATLLNRTRIVGHEVDTETGQSLVFFDRSLMLCCPVSGKMHHYPKHLLHCFVDDNRCDFSDQDGSSSGPNYSPFRQQASNFAGKRVADQRWRFQKYRQRSLVG